MQPKQHGKIYIFDFHSKQEPTTRSQTTTKIAAPARAQDTTKTIKAKNNKITST